MPYRPIRPSTKARVPGVVYVIHFPTPYRHAKHYTGWALPHGLEARLGQHVRGQGSPLVYAMCRENGITTTEQLQAHVAVTYEGDRYLERKLKNMGGAAKRCPVCQGRDHEQHHESSHHENDAEVGRRVA